MYMQNAAGQCVNLNTGKNLDDQGITTSADEDTFWKTMSGIYDNTTVKYLDKALLSKNRDTTSNIASAKKPDSGRYIQALKGIFSKGKGREGTREASVKPGSSSRKV
ncbi:hypothetical protein D9613_008124 [Agrocybe pediades]|uniref:Uncharacterized protein n=1 Tax=Agrocybe pediades TaxID=84607 RepID=A0A8H4VKZ6_9AGAR|nr:hypothetical protein D9613_008124 [Agrocybe pediades]